MSTSGRDLTRILAYLALMSLVSAIQAPAQARLLQLDSSIAPVLDMDHPRLAFAPDGSFAIAMEILTQEQFESQPVRKVAVQRYSPLGLKVGPLHVFKGESCSTLDVWLFDYMMHPEIAFRTDGVLVVMMQHSGRFVIGNDDVGASEATIAAINEAGQVIDLNSSDACLQHKLIFVGSGRGQQRPRMALAPDNSVIMTADGFFNRSDFRNVGIRVLDAGLQTVFEQGIPHADVLSESSFHAYPDIVTNGTLALSTWHRCPVIDPQGNANECDVEAQFISSPISASPQTLGGNQTVTQGDPQGTISMWPSAAMNDAGHSVVVWADTRTGSAGEIFGQRFNPSGQPVGPNFQISQSEGAIYFRPEVAMLDDGRFMAVWTDSSTSGFSARGRQFAADGSALGPPVLLSPGSTLHTGRPTVASTGTGFETIWLAGAAGMAPHAYTSHAGIVTSAHSEIERPAKAALTTVYPNPAQTLTTIEFALPADGYVELRLHDVLGREVLVIENGWMRGRLHRSTLDVGRLSPGSYLLRLSTPAGSDTRTLIKVR